MSLEVYKGTTNIVTHDTDNQTVTKEFFEGNGIGRSFFDRIIAEAQSIRKMPLTPNLYGFTNSTITMSFLEGDKFLDTYVEDLPEELRNSIYKESGKTLRSIHEAFKIKLPDSYHVQHRKEVYELLAINANTLQRKDIDPMHLLDFLEETYAESEVEHCGLAWIHGDFWLNNIIGKQQKTVFQPSGVIDWELAGMGSPYEDFAIVKSSIEDQHEDASDPFWKGYGKLPEPCLLQHYNFVKILEWVRYDDPQKNGDYSSNFYQQHFSKIRATI